MSSHRPAVLIVGAGSAGLVLALSLQQNGVPFRIIEKQSSPRTGSRGSGIMPRSQELYEFLGVMDELRQVGRPTPQMRLYKLPGGTEILRTWDMVEKLESTPSAPYTQTIVVGQDHAEAMLIARLERLGTKVEIGTELCEFEQDDDHVTAKLVVRQDGKEVHESIDFDFLVGADGAKGIVRKSLGLPFLGETHEVDRMVLVDLQIDGLSEDYWHSWGNMASIMVVARPDRGRFTLFVGGLDVDHAALAASPDKLCDFVSNFIGRPDLTFRSVTWITDYRPNMRVVNKFGHGRVFLAGDAAHVHSFFGAQGLNSSVMDSCNLAWKLSLVHKGLAPLSLLETYTHERLPVIIEMLDHTRELHEKTFKENGDDAGMEESWFRGKALMQLGVNYRWSSIVYNECDGEDGKVEREEMPGNCYGQNLGDVRAGDRAPEAPGLVDITSSPRESRRLFQLFRPSHHTLLLFTDSADSDLATVVTPWLDAVQHYPECLIGPPVVFVPSTVTSTTAHGFEHRVSIFWDEEGHAYRAYASDGLAIKAVIVRPDGVIGGIVCTISGLQRYFKGILIH